MSETDAKIQKAISDLSLLRDDAIEEGHNVSAMWLKNAIDQLRRTRFHERELFDRVQGADAFHGRLGIDGPWEPDDGDRKCQEPARIGSVALAEHAVWNEVMPDDGVLCPTCFLLRADKQMGGAVWRITRNEAPPSAPIPNDFDPLNGGIS